MLSLVVGVLPKPADCTARELYLRGIELVRYIVLTEPSFVFSQRTSMGFSDEASPAALYFPEGSLIRRGNTLYYLGHERLAADTLVRSDTVYRVVGIARPESLRLFGRVEDTLGLSRVKRAMLGYWRRGIRHTLYNVQCEFSDVMERYTYQGEPDSYGQLPQYYNTITGEQAVSMILARWEGLRDFWVEQYWAADSSGWVSAWADSVRGQQ